MDRIIEHEDDKHFQDEKVIMEYCYNCKYNIKLHKHPSNKTIELKGGIRDEASIFACSVFYECEGENGLIVLDDKYGSCEMFEEIKL